MEKLLVKLGGFMKIITRKTINCPICGSEQYNIGYSKTYKVFIDNEEFIWPTQQVICKNVG